MYKIYEQKTNPCDDFKPSKYHMEMINNIIDSNSFAATTTTKNAHTQTSTYMFSLRTCIVQNRPHLEWIRIERSALK